jgi:hypothetical protein
VNLDGLVMSVSSTGPQSVVGSGTLLYLRQKGSRVFGRYGGGSVSRGYLVGQLTAQQLVFRYTQVEAAGEIHGGRSVCELEHQPDGRARIVEHFTWRTRVGSGTNVFDEVTP